MKLTQALVVTCLLAQVLCQAGAKKRKSRGGKKDWRLARLQQLISPMQEDIKELQELVESLSNPIHIHMHGLSRVETSAVENGTRHTHEEDRYDDHSDDHGDDHDDDHGDDHGDDHDDDHGHKHHGRGHRHGRHHKHGERKRKCKKCKHHGEKKRTDEEDKDHGDDDDDDDEGGKQNQRHIHIHLNVAPSGDGGDRRESCLTEEDEHAKDEYKHGCCKVFPNSESGLGMQGNIYLRHKPHSQMEVKVILKDSGSAPGRSMHGIHVHEFADVSNGCNAFGGHYNPKGHNHGGPDAEEKHPGDWGNLEAEDGVIVTAFNVSGTLFGRESMIGRGIVIHAGTDDLGKGENHESHKTGNAGARIACCAITLCEGHLNPNLGLGE